MATFQENTEKPKTYRVRVEQKREYSGYILVHAPSPGHANEIVDDMLGGSEIEKVVWDKEPKSKTPVQFEGNHPEEIKYEYTNKYSHCGEDWEDDECDSMHNDKCPKCNKEIEPYESVDNATGAVVNHVIDRAEARDDKIRKLAKKTWHDEGSVEIDEDAEVCEAEGECGAYVAAWVWADFQGTKLSTCIETPGTRICAWECACHVCGDTFYKGDKAYAEPDTDGSVLWYCDDHKPEIARMINAAYQPMIDTVCPECRGIHTSATRASVDNVDNVEVALCDDCGHVEEKFE